MLASYAVVVPVKPPTIGKSRLQGLSDDERRALAEAFALDTVAACLRTPSVAQVLVATDDAAFSRHFAALGCATVPDGDSSGLNSALRQAAAEAGRLWPALVPVALCADLPALRSDDLAAALEQAGGTEAAFVADADGLGTTLYLAPHVAFDPCFGIGSRQAHVARGAREIEGALLSLRRDVDDLTDLRAARDLGLGPETERLTAGLSWD